MKPIIRSIFAVVLLLCMLVSTVSRAATEYWPVTTGNSVPITNALVQVSPVGTVTNGVGGFSSGATFFYITDANGLASMTNLQVGTFKAIANGPFNSTYTLTFTITNSAQTNYVTDNSTVVYNPNGTSTAYNTVTSDNRYLLNGRFSGATTTGYVPMLTNGGTNIVWGPQQGGIGTNLTAAGAGVIASTNGATTTVSTNGLPASSATNFTGTLAGNVTGTQSSTVVSVLPAISGAALTSLTGANVTGVVASASNAGYATNAGASSTATNSQNLTGSGTNGYIYGNNGTWPWGNTNGFWYGPGTNTAATNLLGGAVVASAINLTTNPTNGNFIAEDGSGNFYSTNAPSGGSGSQTPLTNNVNAATYAITNGSFSGNGAGLTNITATNLNTGTNAFGVALVANGAGGVAYSNIIGGASGSNGITPTSTTFTLATPYTNSTTNPVIVTGLQAVYNEAAVSGTIKLTVAAAGTQGITNVYSHVTTVLQTNNFPIPSITVPGSGTLTFTDGSTGAGNSVGTTIIGQVDSIQQGGGGSGATNSGTSGIVPNEVWVETNGVDATALTFITANHGGSANVPFLTIQAAANSLQYPANNGGIIHVGYGRFTAPGAFFLTNLTVTQGGTPSPAVSGNYVLGGDPSFPSDYYGLNGSSNYYITAVAGSYWKIQNKSRTAFYQISGPLFGTWSVTNSATGAITVVASATDPLYAAKNGWHFIGKQMPTAASFANSDSSIIVGTLAFDMNNCSVEELGVDVSASSLDGIVMQNSQHSNESVPYAGNGQGNPQKYGCWIRRVNIIGHGTTDGVHACLMENLTSFSGEYIWTYNTGIGVVLKATYSGLSHIYATDHTLAGLYVRDEDYAPLDNFTIDNAFIQSESGMTGIVLGAGGGGASGDANVGTIYASVRTPGIGVVYSLPYSYIKGTISLFVATTNSTGTIPTYLLINN